MICADELPRFPGDTAYGVWLMRVLSSLRLPRPWKKSHSVYVPGNDLVSCSFCSFSVKQFL